MFEALTILYFIVSIALLTFVYLTTENPTLKETLFMWVASLLWPLTSVAVCVIVSKVWLDENY